MGVEAQRCEGPDEQPGIGDRVGNPNFPERPQIGERVIEMVRPVKRASSCAETLLAVRKRRVTGQHGTEVDCRVLELHAHVKVWVAEPIVGGSASGRTRCTHKVNRYAHIHAEVLAEVVAHAGVEFVDLAVTV